MRTPQVLHKCLKETVAGMHALRRRALFTAAEALINGRRLTLMDLARSWPGAERVRAPLKVLDRLLGNRQLHAEREQLYGGMARWLVRTPRPVIVVDWSDLKDDGSWFLLRAAVPVGGRTLPILDMVFPAGQQGSRKAEKYFLERLNALLPEGVCPVLVTDAGFRTPWFRAVSALGWLWVGRLRHRTHINQEVAPGLPAQWGPCKSLYALARRVPRDLGLMLVAASQSWTCRVIVYGKPPQHRKDRNRDGSVARRKHSRQNARRESEPWLLLASPALAELSARQLVALYAKRMQIESSFRDLKSHRYGQGFEDSLTRQGPRIAILLLIHALAMFASWLVGLACEAMGLDERLAPYRTKRRLYSIVRIGREALVRRWLCGTLASLLNRLRYPDAKVLEQIGSPV